MSLTRQPQPPRLKRTGAGLVIIDIQERLLPAIFEKERVVANAVRLAKGAAILGIPAMVTEQYRRGLGATVPEVAAGVARFTPIEKMAFSGCGAPVFTVALAEQRISSAVLCGIEAHVCVTQTCLDLLERGVTVFVVADAISSRTAENWRLGLDRMREAGAVIVSTEMALFEWLGEAGTDEFRQILPLVK